MQATFEVTDFRGCNYKLILTLHAPSDAKSNSFHAHSRPTVFANLIHIHVESCLVYNIRRNEARGQQSWDDFWGTSFSVYIRAKRKNCLCCNANQIKVSLFQTIGQWLHCKVIVIGCLLRVQCKPCRELNFFNWLSGNYLTPASDIFPDISS